MSSDDPGLTRIYAIYARKHLAALRRTEPGIHVEIRCCPSHKGIEGNEMADRGAKMATEDPKAVELDGVSTLIGMEEKKCHC
jgi:ribonuclease HI